MSPTNKSSSTKSPPAPPGKYRIWFSSSTRPDGPWTVDSYKPSLPIVSSTDTCIGLTHKGPPYLTGGDFYVWHDIAQLQVIEAHGRSGSREYMGPVCLHSLPPAVSIGDYSTELFSLGAAGFNKAKPGKPEVALANFLAELKDVPRLVRTRSLSGAFLGYQFGVAPVISDLRKMYEMTKKIDTLLKQLRRDNGQYVRRRVGLGQSTDSSTTIVSGGGYVGQTLLLSGTQRRTHTIRSEQKFWFSGRFRYFIPDMGKSHWTPNIVRKLYGLDVNPEVVWNAIPWSWLADWYYNVGDIMSNLSSNAAEDLIMDYGFVMGQKSIESEYQVQGSIFNYDRKLTPLLLSAKRSLVTKRRKVAYPYSFGPKPGDMSTRQIAILGALGFNRSGTRI